MNYKLEGTLRKNKKTFIFAGILWLVLIIVFVLPIARGVNAASNTEGKALDIFMNSVSSFFMQPGENIATVGEYWSEFVNVLKWYTFAFIVILIIGLIKTAPKSQYEDIEHGSSDWCEHGEQYKVLSPKKGIILGEKNYLPVDKRGNVNVLVVGGSGAGKSASFSIPNACQLLGSYVFTDPKGELFDATSGFLKANGYEIKVLNLIRPENSDGYNPLMHINSELDVDVIANTVVKGQSSESKGSDPYWEDMAEMLLKSLIYYLLAKRPKEEQNLESCSELVRAANSNGGSNLLTELINKLPIEHPARKNYKSIEIAPEKTYGSILSTLQSKLGKFDSKEIAELTSTNTIDFPEIGRKKTAVYVISSDTHTAYDFLLTIFFSQMIQQLYDFADLKGGKLPVPTYFILDEFANIGRIPDFDKKISTSRSRKIQFSVILQNLDQLEAVYEKSFETIIGNCDTHVFLGSNSQKTVEYFSKALGNKTISRESISVSKDKAYNKQGTNESENIMERNLLTPDELRRFDVDKCIIFEKGIRPIQAKKYYYFKHKEAKLLKRYPTDHNDREIDRGNWRTFNPYNPYVEESEKQPVQDLKIDSLDDLFGDDINMKEEKKPKLEVKNNTEKKIENKVNKEDAFSDLMLPMDEEIEKEKKEDDVDLAKAIEDKFDEIFGPIDDTKPTAKKS